MPPGPNFYETFNPESIVPLAMKKFDIDLKKRQLDMMEQEHNLKIESAARDVAVQQEWKNFMAGKETPSGYSGVGPEEAGGGGMKVGAPGIETKIEPPGLQEMYKKILELKMPKPEDALKAMLGKEEKFGASAGRIYSQSTGAISSEKPVSPPTVTLSESGKLNTERIMIQNTILEASKKGEPIDQGAVERIKEINAEIETKKTNIKEPKTEPVSEYRTFYESQKALGKTDAQIDEAWQSRKLKLAEAGAKVRTAGSTFKEGTLDYMVELFETEGKVPSFGMGTAGAPQRAAFWDKVAQRAKDRGDSGAEQVARAAENRSNVMTLTDLTKREQLIESYNVRIHKTTDDVLIPLIKKWDLQNPRFANWPVNKLGEIMGSGDLASLKLALNSVSVEVGKVEFNALGIQQLTDSAAKFMNSVHDPNMKVSEILKVLDTSKALGRTGSEAISGQRKSLKARMKTNVATPKSEGGGKQIGRFTVEVEGE